MSQGRVTRVWVTGVDDSISLGDVRWLLDQAKTLADTDRVTIKIEKRPRGGDQRETGQSELSVDLRHR